MTSRSLAGLAALGVALAGCGGSSSGGGQLSDAAYKQKIRPILVGLGTDLQQLGATARASSDPQRAIGALNRAGGALNTGADKVEALKAPSKVADANRRLASALRDGASYIRSAVPMVKRHDLAALARWKDSLASQQAPFLGQLRSAAATIRAKLGSRGA